MSRTATPPARRRLGVEPLEAREVPAAWSYLADAGHTLILSGDGAADAVTVTQNDKAGTLTVTGVGSKPVVYPAAAIGTVSVNLRGGNDRFEYATAGEVWFGKQLRVDLGDGADTAVIRWADDRSTAKAGVTALVYGQGGDDAIGVRVGALAAGVTVTTRAFGGAGNDALQTQALAPGRGAKLDVLLRGEAGDDDTQVSSTGDLAAGGSAAYDLAGDGGADAIRVDLAGRFAGGFTVRADGGADADQVALTSGGISGPAKPRVALLGGAGDDVLASLAEAKVADVTADGGAGDDFAYVVNGVRVSNVELAQEPSEYERRTGPATPFHPILPTRTRVRDGRTTEYWTAGTSAPGVPVVVLFSGYGNTIDTWATVATQLSAKYHVIAVNRPGYGRSSGVADYSGADVVAQTRAVVRELAGDRPVLLVGHSLGGLYANLYARLHPDETAGVVFDDSSAPEQFAFGGGDLAPTGAGVRLLTNPGMVPEGVAAPGLGAAVLAAPAFPAAPVVSLRGGSPDQYDPVPELGEIYLNLGRLGSPGETRFVSAAGHFIHFDQPAVFLKAVADVAKLATRQESRTVLTPNLGTGTAGDRVVLTAAIGGGSATGTVTFKLGTTVLGTAPLVGGKASIATTRLPAGMSQVTAEYSGDRKLMPSRGTLTVRMAAPSADSQFVSSVLADAAKKYSVPGLSAAVVVGGKVVTGAAGVWAAGTTNPARPGDTFHNGSTTKAMTATLAGVLVDQKIIRWDSTIGEVFPDLRAAMRPEYRAVTLEALLQHRGGIIADDEASPALGAALLATTGDPTAGRRNLLPLLFQEPPANPVGTFHYSNGGYTIAAAMLERITGQPYETLMQTYVFGPLGMASATFDPPTGPSPVGHDQAGDLVPYGSVLYQATDFPVLNPAGANLRMTAADWAKFVQVHLGQTVNGVRLLTAQTLARLHTPAFPDLPANDWAQNYAAGWLTRPAGFGGNNPALGASIDHDGSDGFWLAEVEIYPSARFAVLVMTNTAFAADGSYLGTEAYAEIKARLTERFAPTPAPATLPQSATVRQVLTDVRAATGVPAVAAGVIVGGQTVGLAARGVREAGKPAAVSDDSKFHLGSAGKSMTATLAAVLVERGTIRWTTTVGQMFPELRGRLKPGYEAATLEDLLNHRGGFGDFTTLADVTKYEKFQKAARFASEGRQAYVRDWMTTEAPANPRGVYSYSNIGYTVAGAMLERAANRSYEQLMTDFVFRPLGMTSAVFGLPAAGGAAGQPLGHDENGTPIRPTGAGLPDLLSPSGGVSMTMADWAKYLRMHLGQPVNGVNLLSAAALTKLHTPDPRAITDESGTFRYGFGWRTAETPLGEALGHEGAVPGFYARVGILPSLGVAVFAAVNELSEVGATATAAVTTAVLDRLAAAG